MNGNPKKPQMVDLKLETDSSFIGWGAKCTENTTQGFWTNSEVSYFLI